MKDILVATYTRPDTYRGWHKINHYHVPTEIRCYIFDNSEEREIGMLVNGEPCEDEYAVCTYNYKGNHLHTYHFKDRSNANEFFVAIMKKFGDFHITR